MNTPNKLTVARMILVPFLVLFMLTDLGGEANRYIALAIFVVASVTDWFDGKLARKYNLVTNFGKFMDPLADKLLVCSAMICFIELEKLPAWFVIIIIGREFIISGGDGRSSGSSGRCGARRHVQRSEQGARRQEARRQDQGFRRLQDG